MAPGVPGRFARLTPERHPIGRFANPLAKRHAVSIGLWDELTARHRTKPLSAHVGKVHLCTLGQWSLMLGVVSAICLGVENNGGR